MGGRRIALVTLAALTAAAMAGGARAQPKDPDGEIEMDPEPTAGKNNSTAAKPGAGSAAGTGTTTTPGAGSSNTAAGSGGAVVGSSSASTATTARDVGQANPPASARDPRAARKWLAAARVLMQKGSYFTARNRPDDARPQFENAVLAYQRAIEVGDDLGVYVDLASAEEKLGKLDDAVRHLRRVIAPASGARADVVKKATTMFGDLSARIGFVTLTVVPGGTSVTLGGTELGTAPLPEPLVLMPGTYTLSFQAEGFQPREAEIKVEAGSEIERLIELEPVKMIVEPPRPAPIEQPVPDDTPPAPSALPLYVGAGIAGAGALGAGIFGILAIGQHSTFTGRTTSTLDREDARTNGQRLALAADLSLGAAVAAAGFTAYWYFARYRQPLRKLEPRHARSPVDAGDVNRAKLDAFPWVQPKSGGVIIAGWF